MPIVITTNDSEQQFTTKEEVNFNAVQSQDQEIETDNEKKTEESATKENSNNEVDKDFNYLNSEEESDDDTEHDDDSEDDEDDDTEKDVETQPKKNGFKKRIDKLTKRNSEYENRIMQLEALVNANNNNANNNKKPDEIVVKDLKEPSIDDFEEYSDYIKALTKYEVNQENKALKAKQEEELIQKEAEQITQKYRERVEDAKKRYGQDNWNKLNKIDLPMSVYIRSEIMQSEIGPDVLYYLYNNLEENKRINSLTPAGQIKELTKLELKISNKLSERKATAKKDNISNAPAPVKPLSSKTDGTTFKDPNKMSYQEYKKWHAEKESKKR